ncbi:ash family protein [Serratia sp. IR-2025]
MLGLKTSRIMVAQVGASQEAPVSFVSGNANSAWATTMGLASHVVVRILHTKDKTHGKCHHHRVHHKYPYPLPPTV